MINQMELHTFHKALGNKIRWDLLNCLVEEALCGIALADRLGIQRSVVSQQINFLQRTGLVTSSKRGNWTFYEVNKKLLEQFQQGLNEWFNQTKKKQTKICKHQENPIKKGKRKEASGYCKTECLKPAKHPEFKETMEGPEGEKRNYESENGENNRG